MTLELLTHGSTMDVIIASPRSRTITEIRTVSGDFIGYALFVRSSRVSIMKSRRIPERSLVKPRKNPILC